MRLIGLLITAILLALVLIWGINLSLENTRKATSAIPSSEGDQIDPSQPGTGALEYSKQKLEEVNKLNQERNEEIDNLAQ